MIGTVRPYWRNFIGGDWVDGASGESIAVENPATGAVIAEVARAVPADIDRAVAAARAAFSGRVMLDMRPSQRGELMFAIARQLETMRDEIATVECLDNGKNSGGGACRSDV